MPARVRITFGQPIDPMRAAEQNAATSNAEQATIGQPSAAADPTSDEKVSDEHNPRQELATAERMILQWGKQIVTFAGRPDWPIELAGRSRLSRAAKESLQ